MPSIEDIIIASYNEKPTEVKSAFNDVMREKILAALEKYNGDDIDSDDEASDEDESDVEVEVDDDLEIDDYSDTEESEDGNT